MCVVEYMYLWVIFMLFIWVLWVSNSMEYMFWVWYYNCGMIISRGNICDIFRWVVWVSWVLCCWVIVVINKFYCYSVWFKCSFNCIVVSEFSMIFIMRNSDRYMRISYIVKEYWWVFLYFYKVKVSFKVFWFVGYKMWLVFSVWD